MSRIWLEAWMADLAVEPEAAYRAAVAFSEVVTNAVLHGSGLISVTARIEPGLIACEVADGAADLPVVYEAGDDDEHHRGLSLVDALASDWRVSALPDGGKTVAFTVRTEEEDGDGAAESNGQAGSAASNVSAGSAASNVSTGSTGSTGAVRAEADCTRAPAPAVLPAPNPDPDALGRA
jgi:anti-sigma regulatory factor (Ser/Thr protein kinase)